MECIFEEMRKLFLSLFYWVFRFLLSLRYRIEVTGLEEIEQGDRGMLICPNHPAEMDPLIMIAVFWKKFKLRPLVIEHFYYQKGLRFFMDLVRVLPIPSMDVGNQWKVKQVEKLKQKIIQKLSEGENFLIYPSGSLMRGPEEKVGGASLVSDILCEIPDTRVILVRTTGLWGSTFSRAITGHSPDFGKTLFHGFKILLKNGIFFAPKRTIKVEIEETPEDFPKRGEKMEINRSLENWYNKEGPQPFVRVSFAFWKEEYPEVTAQDIPSSHEEEVEVPEETRAQILGYLSKMTRRIPSELKPEVHLFNDLGLDSLDVSQINTFLEDRFDISGIAPGQLQTIHDVMQAAAGVVKPSERPKPEKKKSKWPRKGDRPSIEIPKASTLQEAFLLSCQRLSDHTACADSLSGAFSYNRFKRAALVLALEIEKMPGEHIGILLPSSVVAYVTIFATLLAGKIPVMLNWTMGFRNLEHAQEVCKLEVVLSSFRFLSRLEHADFGKVDDALLLLEKLRGDISFTTKWKGLLRSFYSTKSLLKKMPKVPKADDQAVVIFTSGTETLPKGVPLSHKNLLSNQRNALASVHLYPSDTLYGVLPPFHSFGFSITGILPILSGIRVCYAPDPTDGRALANDIEHYKPTVFCCAPSFVMGMLRVAEDRQLESLRLVVTGAEKAPEELYHTLIAKGKVVLEGYGISECSPVVTLERENEPHQGVGHPLPQTELMVIDPETEEVLEEGAVGEICIHGPSVFSGYIGVDRNPFIKRKGKKWYRSGDRGRIDSDGTLILTGRLKRFVKIGGEMISMGGLEEDLLKICREKGYFQGKKEGIPLAVVTLGRESEKPQLVLFTIFDLDRDALNTALREMGHGRLIKISEVRKIEEIPTTGTGKTQYRMLEEML